MRVWVARLELPNMGELAAWRRPDQGKDGEPMNNAPRDGLVAAAALAVASVAMTPAAHASLLPSYTEYQSGTSGPGTITSLATPGAYSYSDTALAPASSTGGVITGSAYPSGYSGASFYDAFLIDITNSDGSSISSTINLGSSFEITNFQERLYSYTGTAPTVGPISGALDFWTTAVSFAGSTGTVAELPSTYLAAGTYVLEVRGDVTGSTGGAYSGTLQLSPVPLPGSLPLLLGGLGALGLGPPRRHRT